MAKPKLHCELYVDTALFVTGLVEMIMVEFGNGKHCHGISTHNIVS